MSTHDDDTDPTGMRALLQSLPDPGPMPDDLVQRIQHSLAELPAEERSVSRGTSGASGASGATSRPSWWSRSVPRLAVAAVVLVGGGALATGQLGRFGSSSDDSSSADSAAGGFSEGKTLSPGAAPATPSQDLGKDGDRSAAEDAAGPVVLTLSDRTYTAEGFASQIRGSGSGPTLRPLTAESPGIGPIGTEVGVRSCLAALGHPQETGADVDLGTFNGIPAAVVVVGTQGARTAYAVGRDCTTGNPSILLGPITLP